MASSKNFSATQLALEAELESLRAENAHLRAKCNEAPPQQSRDDESQHSKPRFRTVFENSPLGQKIITPDLKIVEANAALLDMMELSGPEELLGRRILDFAHPDHHDDWRRLQERLWKHKLPNFSLETCLMRPDGTSFWCQVTSVLFADEEGQLGYTTLEDISDRKSMEIALKRLYDAQETILHLVAHDLKTPINNIEMVADLLQHTPAVLSLEPAEARAEVMHLLTLIDQGCDQACTLLKDVLYLGQLEATRLEKQRTHLNAFLEEHLAVFRLAAQEKGIHLKLELPQEPVYDHIHGDKFGRVLNNLLANALKFTPANGTVQVSLRVHEGRTRLVVHDTGLGIPEELLPRVFEKFSPASRPGLYGDTTTGLGLYITKQIVELHRGKIWVESKENEGTTFYIELA